MTVNTDDVLPGVADRKTRFSEPKSIEEAHDRLYGTPEVRGLIGSIEDIQLQLGDATRRKQPGYDVWRSHARKALRMKNEELRYLKHWISKARVSRKMRDTLHSASIGSVDLLKSARTLLERYGKKYGEKEAGELAYAIDLHLQHIA